PDALLIFLAAPSAAELERRLRARKTDSPEQLTVRIETAQHETEQAGWFDVTIVNETGAVGQTVARIIETMEEQRRRVPARRVGV
ncbi:MAG: guanylate kinase, partial [Chloroflexi bacterium]|nr:guanylate kinase [Chloroflexota bacterium]